MDERQMYADVMDAAGDGDFEPNEWEEEFLQTVEENLKYDRSFTEAQSNKLREIWEKVTGN